jgi:hypothetical protein
MRGASDVFLYPAVDRRSCEQCRDAWRSPRDPTQRPWFGYGNSREIVPPLTL